MDDQKEVGQNKTKKNIRGSFKTFAAFIYPVLVPVEYIVQCVLKKN